MVDSTGMNFPFNSFVQKYLRFHSGTNIVTLWIKVMNNKILIAGVTMCAAAIITYFIKRMKTAHLPEAISAKKSHHLTDAFARAKNYTK